MPVAKMETTGSTESYDSSLGNIKTRVFQCWLADADALWTEFAHNQSYPEYGGYFIRTRSSIDRGPGFATARLVFAQSPDISLNSGSSGSHEDGDTEYDLDVSTIEKQLEAHADYKANWNYELWAIDGTTSSPAWWLTATKTIIEDADDRKKYQWVKPGSVISGWYRLFEVYYEDPPSTVDFRGVEAWEYPQVIMNVTRYYRDRDDAEAQVVETNQLVAPAYTGPYSSDNIYWRITNSRVIRSGKYWCCVTSYKYADRGWNTALYTLVV